MGETLAAVVTFEWRRRRAPFGIAAEARSAITTSVAVGVEGQVLGTAGFIFHVARIAPGWGEFEACHHLVICARHREPVKIFESSVDCLVAGRPPKRRRLHVATNDHGAVVLVSNLVRSAASIHHPEPNEDLIIATRGSGVTVKIHKVLVPASLAGTQPLLLLGANRAVEVDAIVNVFHVFAGAPPIYETERI